MSETQEKELKSFIDNVCKDSHLRVESDLGDGYVRLRASEAQRRQAQQDIRCVEDVVIEMLRNSRDAGAKNIFVATNTEDGYRHILIIDDGVGVPKSKHNNIFEPYVTSKLDTMTQDSWGVHGRGMALYSISVNSEKAYVVNSSSGIGCSIAVMCSLVKLKEKRDQSSFPDFYVNENSELVIRGPKNIMRTCCEFAVENRKSCNVYVGSPAEIASTLYNLSIGNSKLASVFSEPGQETKLVTLLGYSSDVHDFKAYSKQLGINLSKRTARRIMDGDIKPQKSILERISNKGIQNKSNDLDDKSPVLDIFDIKKIYKASPKKRSLKIDDDDMELLQNAVVDNFSKIADKYYLECNISPVIKCRNNKISITFDVNEIE